MFELYGDSELIGIYSTRKEAAVDAFELMLDGCLTSFEIIPIPENPQGALVLTN